MYPNIHVNQQFLLIDLFVIPEPQVSNSLSPLHQRCSNAAATLLQQRRETKSQTSAVIQIYCVLFVVWCSWGGVVVVVGVTGRQRLRPRPPVERKAFALWSFLSVRPPTTTIILCVTHPLKTLSDE